MRDLPLRPLRPPPCLVVLSLAVLSMALTACAGRGPAPPPRPPIILITFEGLGAASVGSGHTPSYDAFAAEADWAGRGVASSSRAVTAGASLATGLNPWRHQVLVPGDRLSPRLITLAEALARLGYHSSGYVSGSLVGPVGFQQGFDFFRTLHRGRGARSHLRALQGGPELVWIHYQHPDPPWVRRDWLFPDGEAPPGLPTRVTAEDLDRYRTSGVEPSAEERRHLEALYLNNVALADVLLGRFLDDLRNSGHWDDVVVAVTSTHGQELPGTGDATSATAGGLSRRLLEVPLAIKLPRRSQPGSPGRGRSVRPAPGLALDLAPNLRVGTSRLFATLVEAAGGRVPPGVAPSLFRSASSEGVLSELYDHRGANWFSWLRGDLQLLWRLPLPSANGSEGGDGTVPPPARFEALPIREPPGESGDGGGDGAGRNRAERLLLRWTADGTEPVDDARQRRRLTAELRRRWTAFLPADAAPVREVEELLTQHRRR
jgi:hypothetical protein